MIGHVGTVEDVTERRRAEEAVRRERDFAEGLIATAQAIVLVLDGEGRIVRVNPFLEQVTGCRPDEVRGEDWFATFVPPRDRAAPARRPSGPSPAEDGEPVIYPILAAGRRPAPGRMGQPGPRRASAARPACWRSATTSRPWRRRSSGRCRPSGWRPSARWSPA